MRSLIGATTFIGLAFSQWGCGLQYPLQSQSWCVRETVLKFDGATWEPDSHDSPSVVPPGLCKDFPDFATPILVRLKDNRLALWMDQCVSTDDGLRNFLFRTKQAIAFRDEGNDWSALERWVAGSNAETWFVRRTFPLSPDREPKASASEPRTDTPPDLLETEKMIRFAPRHVAGITQTQDYFILVSNRGRTITSWSDGYTIISRDNRILAQLIVDLQMSRSSYLFQYGPKKFLTFQTRPALREEGGEKQIVQPWGVIFYDCTECKEVHPW
jgi:hypothetical protein